MAMSPARAHFLRASAELENRSAGGKAAAITSGGARPVAGRMDTLARMRGAEFSNIESLAARIAAKRAALPEFAPYVDGVLASGAGQQDDTLISVMIWRLDAGEFMGALDIAAYALRHGLAMPFNWQRSLPCTVVESIAEAALRDPAPELLGALYRALELTADRDMPDQARAKAYKALGLILTDTDPAAALAHYRIALKLNPKAGVKKDIDRLEKQQAQTQP